MKKDVSPIRFFAENLSKRFILWALLGFILFIDLLVIIYVNIEMYLLNWVLVFYVLFISTLFYSVEVGRTRQVTGNLYVRLDTNKENIEGFLIATAQDHYIISTKERGSIIVNKSYVNTLEHSEIPDLEFENETEQE